MKIKVFMSAIFSGVIMMCCGYSGSNDKVLIPVLSAPWDESMRIIGDGETFYSDFCFFRDKADPPRWHAVGIHQAEMDTMFHAVSDSITQGWALRAPVTSPDPVQRMWAPFAIWNPEGTQAYMYYHHQMPDHRPTNSMRMLVADGPRLENWRNYEGDKLPEEPLLPGITNVVFPGATPRDACIFFDDNVGKYIMYYADQAIMARTSSDLFEWSDPVQVMSTPEPADVYRTAESPFVLYRNGLYYLFVSGFDYGRVALYISEDPFNFGDPAANKISEMSGHAPEIITENGIDYIGGAAIASKPGGQPGEHDMRGVYVQQLKWEEADQATMQKIWRRK